MTDIISCGSSTVDTFIHTEMAKEIHLKLKKKENDFIAYPVGSKILIERLKKTVGGGGINTASCFSKLGLKTSYLASLATDSDSKLIHEHLNENNISFIGHTAKGTTDCSVIMDSKGHDRTVLNYKDVSSKLEANKIKQSNLNAKWIYFSSLTNNAFKEQIKLAKRCKEKNIHIAYNPSSYIANKGLNYFKPMLKLTDALILNKEEAELLTHESNIKSMLIKLSSINKKLIVITDGSQGVYAILGQTFYRLHAHKVKVVEATGAGDTFASTCIASIIKGNSLEESLKLGLTNAESVLSEYGATKGQLTYAQLLKKAKTQAYKLEIKEI